MPVIKSAKKSLRQNKKRRLLNLRRLQAMRQAIKSVKKATESAPKDELQKLLSNAYRAIDKAAKRGVIKKNTAARKKSRLVKSVKRSQPPTSPKPMPSQPDQS